MAPGIGSARMAKVLLLCMLVLHSDMAYAATYRVGDAAGWTFHVTNWPNGKQFMSGDILVFNYAVGAHNVVVVNRAGYQTCSTPPGSTVYVSGNDRITLTKGLNYFICNFPGHCEGGMKIAVNAI
ncbi:hypothetical protein HN51_047506 [Arachis hypogaea]|uniref:Basic blue protein n=1 Tax=Arachis hypogaea TaxID=3818 RepID=A0A445AH51_ARAHY|nr:basic blue protein [Arachis ipaensis]XP_025635336.1 basic blue protein [Arachis hypogaea]QHO23880.1 Basic blue protein [Arachis hypogaea]RYR25718.1 hypothetical protein Ahy_B02g059689 [Arachis hypogaea]